MELYTMDANFQPKEVADDFFSAVWVERYSKAGDIVLTVEPTAEMYTKYAEGTFLHLKGSKEIMIIDSLLQEEGILKIVGNSLTHFLNHRITGGLLGLPSLNPDLNAERMVVGKPGWVIAEVVKKICIDDFLFALPGWYGDDIAYYDQNIPNLTIGDRDASGADITLPSMLPTSMYPVLQQLAEAHSLGFTLYLDSYSSPTTYALKFKTYAGQDRTNTVQFSPNTDTLTDVKLLRSIAEYKDTLGVMIYNNTVSFEGWVGFNKAARAGADTLTGFNKRLGVLNLNEWSPDATAEQVWDQSGFMGNQVLVNDNNHKKIVDGTIVPTADYEYGVDFNLGDIVGLSAYGFNEQVRITEFIRSQDREGERAYPTVSVID